MGLVAPRKSERLINLAILLLSSRRFVPRARIQEVIEDYRDKDEASFERMFERDKDELRAMGFPIETGHNDVLFEDEVGYRISPNDFELPPIDFTPGEATALGLAATVWQQASAAEQTAGALAKLRAAGIEPDAQRLTALAPRISAREAAFDPLWQAVIDRKTVKFRYRDADEVRVVEPWRLAWRNNSWYLLGHDRTRSAPRVFKLSRIADLPKPSGKADAFQVPDDAVMAEQMRSLERASADEQAVIAIRGDRAPALRRRGTPHPAPVPLPEGFTAYQVPVSRGLAAAELASYGPDVIVCEPAGLREKVLDHLRAFLAAHGGER